jgi:hypothetical protein
VVTRPSPIMQSSTFSMLLVLVSASMQGEPVPKSKSHKAESLAPLPAPPCEMLSTLLDLSSSSVDQKGKVMLSCRDCRSASCFVAGRGQPTTKNNGLDLPRLWLWSCVLRLTSDTSAANRTDPHHCHWNFTPKAAKLSGETTGIQPLLMNRSRAWMTLPPLPNQNLSTKCKESCLLLASP